MHCQCRRVYRRYCVTCKSISAMANGLGGNLKVEPIAVLDSPDDLKTVVRLDAAFKQPETVIEPHAAE